MSLFTVVYTQKGKTHTSNDKTEGAFGDQFAAAAAGFYNSDVKVYRMNPDGTKGQFLREEQVRK